LAGIIMFFDDLNFLSVLLIAIAFLVFILQNKNYWENLPFFGLANLITTIRLLLVLTLILVARKFQFDDPSLYMLVIIIPTLDIFDGLIARYRKEESQFGMFYDMEVDAVFVMVASIIIFLNYPSMWIVLIPAFLRYFYKFTIDVFDKKKEFIEKKQKYASIIAGNYFVALIVFYVFRNEWAMSFLIASSILIMLSFGKSYYHFYKWSNELK
jgi:phosphatidylglycerophosphate synthase